MEKKTLLMPNSSFWQTSASKTVPHQTVSTVYFAEVPLAASNAQVSLLEKDVLPPKISWIGSTGTGGVSGQAEIQRLVPDR